MIPENHRIKIIDVISACEDDTEREAFVWQFAQEYTQNLQKQLDEETTSKVIWREKYENLKQEMENVSDFFSKYQRRVI